MNLFQRGLLTDDVPLRVGKTLYTRLGDWPGLLSLAISAAAIAATRRRRSSEAT